MKSLLCIIILVCLTACHTKEAEKMESADVFWQGTSAGYKLIWTKQDFTYEKTGKENLYLSGWLKLKKILNVKWMRTCPTLNADVSCLDIALTNIHIDFFRSTGAS